MKLSTRRKITTALTVACGLMMVLLVLQRQLGWGSHYTLLPDAGTASDLAIEVQLKESQNLMPSQLTALEINDRSLFTQTRTAPAEVVPKQAEVKADVPAVPLTAQLTGVIITPNRKVALLRSAGGDQSFRLREGMPFPGELAGWRVAQINPRSVLFDGAAQGQIELRLDVAKGGPMASPPMSMPSPSFVPQVVGNPPVAPMDSKMAMQPGMNPSQPPPPPNADQAAREAEVQRIIEERRAQMRAEAERMNSGNQ
jgi:hypothetical protein